MIITNETEKFHNFNIGSNKMSDKANTIKTFYVKDFLKIPDLTLQFCDGINIISGNEFGLDILKILYGMLCKGYLSQGQVLEEQYYKMFCSLFDVEKIGKLVCKRGGIKFSTELCKIGIKFENERFNTEINFTNRSSRKINIESWQECINSGPLYINECSFFHIYEHNSYLLFSSPSYIFIEEPKDSIKINQDFICSVKTLLYLSRENGAQIFVHTYSRESSNIIKELINQEATFKLHEV